MSGPELILMSRWPGTQNPPASTTEVAGTTGTTADPALSQALNTGLVSRIRRKHQLSPFLLLLCSSSKVSCSFWLLEGSQCMSTDKVIYYVPHIVLEGIMMVVYSIKRRKWGTAK